MKLLRCGERAVLVELDDLDHVLAVEAAVREQVSGGADAWADVVEIVPAARTLLVSVSQPASLAALTAALPGAVQAAETAGPQRDPEVVEIEVRYDGPDLADVAELTGLTRAEVVAAHTGTPWRVAFGGFAPGFAYLADGDPRLDVPRRSSPRTSVPAGSVALAGAFAGIYPRSSPGGWQLLGRTDAVLWDVDRDPPALLRPGCVVHFVEVGSDVGR